ncbi:hypothetical protein BB779_16465 [Pseudomonas viridiflava]|nr:hypothetical protein BB779_16465 [Pseudomonas viridiflava]
MVGLLGDKLLPSNLVKGTREYEQAQANLLALSQIVAVLGATAGNSDAQVAAAVAANATQYNWLLHSEIRAADEARAACGKMGGNVEACQANITRGMDELDKARDYELEERKRLIQLQSFKDGGWSLGEYNKALFDDYFALKGVDPNQVTFNGYAPAKTLGYMLSERGIGSINEAIQWPGKIVDSLAGLAQPINTAVGAAQDIWSAANSGVEWATSPIPAQGLERLGDQLLAQSDQQAGALIFDVATGLITSVSGGIVTKWIGGRWVTVAANDKNLTISFVDADAGTKGPASGLVTGETSVVGTGKAAANDSSYDGFQSEGGNALQLLPEFSNGRKAFEHYAKHSQGVVLGAKGKAVAKQDGADMPEFTSLDSYVSAARSFWSPSARSGFQQGLRADGSTLRFEPSTGYFGVMRNGKMNTFFRPDGDAAAQLKYFKDQL